MDIIEQVPAVIRILCVFGLILAAIQSKFSLGTAFLADLGIVLFDRRSLSNRIDFPGVGRV